MDLSTEPSSLVLNLALPSRLMWPRGMTITAGALCWQVNKQKDKYKNTQAKDKYSNTADGQAGISFDYRFYH